MNFRKTISGSLQVGHVLPLVLSSLIGCTTTAKFEAREWTMVPTPDDMGTLSHAYCSSTSDAIHIFGGIDEHREGPFNSRGFSYDLQGDTWTSWAEQNAPNPKQNFAATNLPGGIFLFGGTEAEALEGTNDAFIYSVEDRRWSSVEGSHILDPRSRASATRWDDEIFIYGGKGAKAELNAGIYSLSRGTWELLTSPKGLGTRVSHAAVAVEDMVFLWGGFQGADRVGDGYLFDRKRRTWIYIEPSPLLGSRANSKAFAIDSKVYVLGGSSDEKEARLGAVFDIRSMSWSALPEGGGEALKDIRGFEAIAVGEIGILVRAGRSPSLAFHDEEYFLDLRTDRWLRLDLKNAPRGTLGSCLGSAEGNLLYSLGGIYKVPDRGLEHLDGLWKLRF